MPASGEYQKLTIHNALWGKNLQANGGIEELTLPLPLSFDEVHTRSAVIKTPGKNRNPEVEGVEVTDSRAIGSAVQMMQESKMDSNTQNSRKNVFRWLSFSAIYANR